MRRLFILAVFGAGGCSLIHPATYGPPTADEAKAGYVRTITDDGIHGPTFQVVERGPETIVIRKGRAIVNGAERLDSSDSQLVDDLDRLQAIELQDCDWQYISGRLVPDVSYNRIKNVDMAYYCHFTGTYELPDGDSYTEKSAGYFHRDRFGWIYSGFFQKGPGGMVLFQEHRAKQDS